MDQRLHCRPSVILSVLSLVAVVGGACSDSGITSTAATTIDPPGTYQSAMRALVGTGTGGVSVTPQAIPAGSFSATIRVRLSGAKPSTTFIVQRAPEIGRSASSDGVCQRALGLSPWSSTDPVAPSFISFVQPGTTTPLTLTTTTAGDGTLDFPFAAPMIAAGTRFDVMFRLLDDPNTPATVIMSGCFTVTVL